MGTDSMLSGPVVCPTPPNSFLDPTPAPPKKPPRLFHLLPPHSASVTFSICYALNLNSGHQCLQMGNYLLPLSRRTSCVSPGRKRVSPINLRLLKKADHTRPLRCACQYCEESTRGWGKMSGWVRRWPSVTFLSYIFANFLICFT